MDDQPPVVAVQRVTKSYQMDGTPLEILRGIDLRINPGETAAIMGPSGAGKSTLLHILGLLEQPSNGSYHLSGEDVLKLSDLEKSKLRLTNIGFIFQFHHLLGEFTALENVMMPQLISGAGKAEAEAKAEQLLEEVGLRERLRHRPGELSGGEQQRIALARALVNEPRLILADEPTGNLDQDAAVRMQQLLWQVCSSRQAAVVVVTHNQSFAEEAKCVYRMAAGKIEQVS